MGFYRIETILKIMQVKNMASGKDDGKEKMFEKKKQNY